MSHTKATRRFAVVRASPRRSAARTPMLLLAILLPASSACSGASAQEFGRADAAAIRQKTADFVAAYNAKDVDKLVSHFAGNVTLMPPNSSTVRGQDSVRGYYQNRFFNEGATDLRIDIQDVAGHGPLSYVSATYSLRLAPQGKPERRDRGKLLWVARKTGGQWRYEFQIWSSDLPPVAPAS